MTNQTLGDLHNTNTSNNKGTVFKVMGGEPNKRKYDEVYHFENKRPKQRDPITFDDTNLKDITVPHTDPLVISPIINGFKVQRVLVDT